MQELLRLSDEFVQDLRNEVREAKELAHQSQTDLITSEKARSTLESEYSVLRDKMALCDTELCELRLSLQSMPSFNMTRRYGAESPSFPHNLEDDAKYIDGSDGDVKNWDLHNAQVKLHQSQELRQKAERDLLLSVEGNSHLESELMNLRLELSRSNDALLVARSTLLDYDADCFSEDDYNISGSSYLAIPHNDLSTFSNPSNFSSCEKPVPLIPELKQSSTSPVIPISSRNVRTVTLDALVTTDKTVQPLLISNAPSTAKPSSAMLQETKNNVVKTTNKQDQLNAPTGIVGKVRKGLLGWFFPDAHDASENLGEKLEAYYNKETGRWVFPGEVDDVKDPALGPPPTGFNLPTPFAPPISGYISKTLAESSDTAYDPLASMMAPPIRSLHSSFSSAHNSIDGLANMNSTSNIDLSLPLNALLPPAPTGVRMWTPSPIPSMQPLQSDATLPESIFKSGFVRHSFGQDSKESCIYDDNGYGNGISDDRVVEEEKCDELDQLDSAPTSTVTTAEPAE